MEVFQDKRREFHLDECELEDFSKSVFNECQLQMIIRLTCVDLEKKKKKGKV